MNTNLAPADLRSFSKYWVLWYEVSNSYSIVTPEFKTLLDYYFQSGTEEEFLALLDLENASSHLSTILDNISTYLNSCNQPITSTTENSKVFDAAQRSSVKHYAIKGKLIQIYYDSELVLKTIHPALAHLTTNTRGHVQSTFDVYLKHEQLHLFENEQLITSVPQRDYHLMQGKFMMHLLLNIHDKTEADWIGTFHGSTITDGTSSILFVGESGKGKSTLCALLTANGFDLLADDISPMLSETKTIYYNPSAISIKAGAFNVLQPIINGFDNLPVVLFNKTKGPLKYIPCVKPEKDHYPCRAIVLVNYKAKTETKLETVSIKTILETLIPDSWLSPDPIHAKGFLDWLETVCIYQLTYSDTESVTQEVSKLFKQLSKPL